VIGDGWVQLRSHCSCAFAALMLAIALSGCANPDVLDSNEHWFSRPFDWTGRNGGYTFSELKETQDRQRAVTAADLVDANGACPLLAPAPAPIAGPGAMPVSPAQPSLLSDGIALGMTECDVVHRAGAPSSVQIGTNASGARTAVLTYNGGPRPGIYRFEAGRLMDMDGVATAANEPQVAKRLPKKKREPAATERVSTE
jgi:hypothetical protein